MNRLSFTIAALALAASVALAGVAKADPAVLSKKGEQLAARLDTMGVENKWIAGQHINWITGEPDGETERNSGRHTHCSAFVASAAKSFGVYILRPPQHEQELLANAQNEWLAEEGESAGWKPVDGPVEAQSLANLGNLVVASYHSHLNNKPGHIAIIRPAARSVEDIERDGPLAIQAGTTNSASIPVRLGFAGHPHAWNDEEIAYYSHAVTLP